MINLHRKKSDKTCVIILGMHSSGTSCLAGILQNNGVFLGEVDYENRFNKKGNRENNKIKNLNEELLNYNGGSWHSPPNRIIWNSRLARKRDRLIQQLSRKSPGLIWGFKDPRTLFTLPFWLESIESYKLIATFRNPESVAISLSNRKEISLEPYYGCLLWEKYNRKLLEYVSNNSCPLLSFDENITDYKIIVSNILEDLGLLTSEDPVSFYQESLIHFNTVADRLSLPDHVTSLFRRLRDIYQLQLVRESHNKI